MIFNRISFCSSISNIIGVSQNVIDVMKSSNRSSPTILNCLTNLERSSLVTLAVTCMLALETDTPVIISMSIVTMITFWIVKIYLNF